MRHLREFNLRKKVKRSWLCGRAHADVDDIEFGETIEMFAMFEDTGADSDIATNAVIRTISMEYV